MCYIADQILTQMGVVVKEMGELEEYTRKHITKDSPLYLLQKYHGYRNLKQAICSLATTVADIEPTNLPGGQARFYRCRAREYSTAISKMAIFILGQMNIKCDSCIDEIESSDLDAETQQEAKSRVTSQVAKVLKYCSLATSRTWEAFDRLEASCMCETTDSVNTAIAPESLGQELVSRIATSSYMHGIPVLILFICYVYALFQQKQSPVTLAKRHQSLDICAQTLQLVERIHAVTNLTGEIHNIQLADLNTRYQALETVAESCGLRIDNLVDALGVPDEQGNYRSSVPEMEPKLSGDIMQRVEKMEGHVERRLQRLQMEMEQMRKNVNRMDIRLTKRMDGVAR